MHKTQVGPLLSGIPRGFHLAIFAYGQTGSGKTWTMDGDDTDPGILRRAVADLLDLSERSQHKYVI